jgi:CRISPR-associated protein Cas4
METEEKENKEVTRETKKKLLTVTDLSMYLYCPRKFFLEKIKGIKKPVSNVMIEGRIRHEILEEFANREKDFVESLEKMDKEMLIKIYSQFLNNIINKNFVKNRASIYAFKISSEALNMKVLKAMENDILLRVNSVDNWMQKGFSGRELWDNLTPKYLSEFAITSEILGLKGKIDRVMISENIVPFELKTREIQRVFDSDELQLTAYAMLLEEKFDRKIPLGIIEAGNKKHEIAINDKTKQKVVDLIKEVNNLFSEQKIPAFPSNFGKCNVCNLREECDNL